MSTINNIGELLAWGETPSWVENQFSQTYKSGSTTTYKPEQVSNGWGGTKTEYVAYTTYDYGLENISTGPGSSFNSSDWNSWDTSKQGSNADQTYLNGGYGIALNQSSLSYTQDASDLTFGTAITDVETDVAIDANGEQLITVIDNTNGTQALRKQVVFNAIQPVSSGADVSNGYSNTKSIDVGSEVFAEFQDIGASVNSTVTNATTIDTSTTSPTNATGTVAGNISHTYTVAAGYKIQVSMMYDNQTIDLPYTLPVAVSGTAQYSDKFGNSWSAGAGDNINSTIKYGSPNSSYMAASSSTDGTLNATGTITNNNAVNFTTKVTTLVSPNTSTASSIDKSRSSSSSNPISDLPIVLKDGKEVSVGVHYDLAEVKKADGAHLLGSHGDDIIQMGAKNQKVTTHGGSDTVIGSEHDDVIISVGDDKVSSGAGADTITSTTGSTDIDAGAGNDEVNITSKGGGFDDVTLGLGSDQVNLDLNKTDDYSFVIRDLEKREYLDINSDSPVTAAVKGHVIEVDMDGKYVGTISGYVDQFTGLNHYKAADIALQNMDLIGSKISTDKVHDWKDDLIEYGALNGWDSLTEGYGKFLRSKSKFEKNSQALSRYMYDGEVVDEFVDAMDSVRGNKGVNDIFDHIAAAVSELSIDLQNHFKPDLLV